MNISPTTWNWAPHNRASRWRGEFKRPLGTNKGLNSCRHNSRHIMTKFYYNVAKRMNGMGIWNFPLSRCNGNQYFISWLGLLCRMNRLLGKQPPVEFEARRWLRDSNLKRHESKYHEPGSWSSDKLHLTIWANNESGKIPPLLVQLFITFHEEEIRFMDIRSNLKSGENEAMVWLAVVDAQYDEMDLTNVIESAKGGRVLNRQPIKGHNQATWALATLAAYCLSAVEEQGGSSRVRVAGLFPSLPELTTLRQFYWRLINFLFWHATCHFCAIGVLLLNCFSMAFSSPRCRYPVCIFIYFDISLSLQNLGRSN